MSLYDKASLIQIPSGYKAGTLYSVIPNSGAGDFTVTGDPEGEATRVNSQGLIENVSANVPRLDYPFIDGEVQDCPRLLLERQSTNYAPYSEDFNNWGDVGTTITPNAIISPDGTLNASKLVSTANNWRKSSSFTASSGVTYTVSIYAKLDTSTSTTTTRLEVYNGAGSLAANYNLLNETISNSGFTSVFIEPVEDDWYRIGGTYTAGGTNNILYIYPSAGYGTAGTMYFWGAQQEAGSYPTSYIATSGSSVTRTQDDFENSFTGLTSTAATIFLDFETQGLEFNFARLFALNDSVTSDNIYLGIYSTNTIAFFGINNFSGLPAVKDTISFNQRNKIVLAFDGSGNYKYSLNGSIQTGTYAGTSRQYDEIGRGNVIGGGSNNIKIHQLMIFNEVLSNSELQTLTS